MTKTQVDILNNQDKVRITRPLKNMIKQAVVSTLQFENYHHDCEISVLICDNDHIQKLNRHYRGIDKATDVLSFNSQEGDGGASTVEYDPEDVSNENRFLPEKSLGDIVISAEKAAEQANEYGHGILRELAFLVVHATLHILGYDHEQSRDAELEMFNKQKAVMEILNLPR